MVETIGFYSLVGYASLVTGMLIGMLIYSEDLEEK
tara:strand:- start:179 stop:283 length:105 start_codon:yes stop_codon:yes gene_type:complete